MRRAFFVLAFVAALTAPAVADTLYQAPPPAAGPGHPLRLGADHKAAQVGDLVQVIFNFNVNSTSSDVTSNSNSYNLGLGQGTGLANVSLLRFGAGLNGGRQTQSSKTQSGQNTFVSTMEAQVVGVMPSGALRIAGDQALIVNGQKQTLHITGLVRPEDIDSTDSVLSTRVANVEAKFDGNFQEKHKGLIQKILDFIF
ncbi:MAG: flagellar L-ring protein FlgH [Candidatus Eremiobacteraeota bacterium]|jgi:flagellar L-ring protein precursor FlgH|nr:flagellar L-ring protein FlgH [Candidatus Eremiobacteraeota bacterium]